MCVGHMELADSMHSHFPNHFDAQDSPRSPLAPDVFQPPSPCLLFGRNVVSGEGVFFDAPFKIQLISLEFRCSPLYDIGCAWVMHMILDHIV